MAYRLTEDDLADIKKRQDANLATFQRNSGRGLPEATVKTMEKADGIQRDADGAPVPMKAKPARKGKYHNLPTEADGIKFQSKLEAKYYVELALRKKAGEVLYYLRQVPFHLPGGVIYRVDFLIVSYHTGYTMGVQMKREGARDLRNFEPMIVEYVDCKGMDTQDSKNKIKMVQAMYGVTIQIVRKVKSHRSL
jgi:hypothetical protein